MLLMRLRLRWRALLLICLVGACDPANVDPGAALPDQLVRFDSAGIRIHVNPGRVEETAELWRISATPSVLIGSEADENAHFFLIMGVRSTSDGRIVVVDNSAQLRWFDEAGMLVHRFGRKGRGPGEFEIPVMVRGAIGDSLVVWDAILNRLHILADDGGSYRVVQPPSWKGGRPPVGIVGSTALVDHTGAELSEFSQQTRGYRITPPKTYYWISLESGQSTEFFSMTERNMFRSVNASGVPIAFEAPFSSHLSSAVVGENAWITKGLTAEISVFDLDGNLTDLVRLNEVPPPVDEKALADLIAAMGGDSAERQQYWRDQFAGIELPERMPAFSGLMVDDLGLVWARRYRWDPNVDQQWVIFDKSGTVVSVANTPPALDVHQIGEDFVVGVVRDSMGVERVARYHLQRTSGPF